MFLSRVTGVILLISLWTGTARAQSGAILGRENDVFARGLFQEGYLDLAEGVCKAIEQGYADGKGDANEVSEVKAIRFDLRLAVAKRENDLVRRKELVQSVLQDANAFITENSRTKVASTVRDNLPEAYLELGETLTAMLDREQDPEQVASLRQEGQTSFSQAEEYLQKRVERFKEQLGEEGAAQAYAERQHSSASFNLARTYYFHALLYPRGDPEGKKLLEQAVDRFLLFSLDYGDSLSNYEGFIYQGLCHERLDDPEAALEDYDNTISLPADFYAPDAAGQYEISALEADVVSGATLRKVKLLTGIKRPREAVDAAQEFLTKIPSPLLTSSGPALLAAKAEAEQAAGDIVSASTTAQELMSFDPGGTWGARGREILGRLPLRGLPPDKILSVAETTATRGDFARALDLCRKAREAAVGGRDESDIGADSFLLTGNIYRWQGRLHEATVAYDCAAELYPKSQKAGDALWQAVNVYLDLHGKEKRPFYSKRVDERMQALSTRYPKHPYAANVDIIMGRRLEAQQDYAGAVQAYERIAPGAPSYEEAIYRGAKAHLLLALALKKDGKGSETQEQFKQAEGGFQRAMDVLAKAREATLDAQVQQRLSSLSLQARADLATLYLETGAPAKVQPLLAGVDEEGDPDRLAGIWCLRIRALQAQGQTNEAVKLFESLLQKSSNAPGISAAAGVLARALDQAAVDLLVEDPASKAANDFWRKAAYYYGLSIQHQLDELEPLRVNDVREVAQRLYVIGLHLNAVPEGMETFVDWQEQPKEAELWEQAVAIYQKLAQLAGPSYTREIELARTLALLGRVKEGAAIYARLFDQEALFDPADPAKERFNRSVVDNKPELIPAYLEWGVAEHLTGVADKEPERLTRATSIYEKVVSPKNSDENSRLWWQAKYFLIRVLMERGNYDQADIALKNLQRTTSRENLEKFGFKDKLGALEKELKTKVFPK